MMTWQHGRLSDVGMIASSTYCQYVDRLVEVLFYSCPYHFFRSHPPTAWWFLCMTWHYALCQRVVFPGYMGIGDYVYILGLYLYVWKMFKCDHSDYNMTTILEWVNYERICAMLIASSFECEHTVVHAIVAAWWLGSMAGCQMLAWLPVVHIVSMLIVW